MLRRAPLGRGLAGRAGAFEILDKPRFLYVVLDDGPARAAVALVAAGHLPREVRRREIDELDAARVRPQPVVAPDALAPVDAFAVSRERVYELDGLKLLDLEDATVEIAVRIGLNFSSRRLRSATRKY